MLVDDPVHQLEARETQWEEYSAVLVNVRGRHAKHLVQLLHGAVGVHRRGGDHWRMRRRHRRVSVHQMLRYSDIIKEYPEIEFSYVR